MKIRDEGLYKKKYGTFENYIVERWDFDRSRIYQLMNATDLTQKISQIQQKNNDKNLPLVDFLPQNERQIRPLLDTLETDSERVTVWQKVVEEITELKKTDNKAKITAAFVQEKVDVRISVLPYILRYFE